MDWSEKCDCRVIGSRAGRGMVGAYTAARQGLESVVGKAADRFGVMSAKQGGGMSFSCNAALRSKGDEDRMEDARACCRTVVGDRPPEALQDAYLSIGAELVDYLKRDPQFLFVAFPCADYLGLLPTARSAGHHIILERFVAAEEG